MKKRLLLLVFLGVAIFSAQAQIYVDANVIGGANDGSSWANAYTSLQDALTDACANAPADIWVAQGTYYPSVGVDFDGVNGIEAREVTFQLCEGVKLYGGFTSGQMNLTDRDPNPATNGTVLSGDIDQNDGLFEPTVDSDMDINTPSQTDHINGENAYHVVYTTGVSAATVLDGFTITAGNANGSDGNAGGMYNENSSPTVTNCTFSGNTAQGDGGGMYNNSNSSPTVTNCTFSGNVADDGGGMYNNNSSPTVTNCTFSGNVAKHDGGGMRNTNSSSPTVTNCTFLGNVAKEDGGGMYNNSNSSPMVTNCTFSGNVAITRGGGMFNDLSFPTVTNCTFSGNVTEDRGGGMYNNNNSSPTVTNCTFSGNEADNDGGGMFNIGNSSPTVTNCTFSGNSADDGGGMYNISPPTVTNCTFSGNVAEDRGGGMYNSTLNPPTVTNCIIWNNRDNSGTGTANSSIFNPSTSSQTITFSLVQNITTDDMNGNKAGDPSMSNYPQFVAPVDPTTAPTTAGNLRLLPTSPAINMGDNAAVPADAFDVDDDGDTAEPTPDLDLDDRIFFNIVDMGAYEVGCEDFTFTNQIAYVDADAIAGNKDGSDWTNAFTDLQDALEVACNCPGKVTEIWVAEGTYYPDEGIGQTNDDHTSTFQLCNGVALYGGFAGGEANLSDRNVTANVTILSGDIDNNDTDADNNDIIAVADIVGDNAYHVVTGSNTDATAVIDGFTITAGNANGGSLNGFGGGMYNNNGSPTVTNSTFSGNLANFGGGGMYNSNSFPTITNSTFAGNSANSGGGMLNNGSSPTVTNSTFSGNSAVLGGGMCNQSNSSPIVTNSTFAGNSGTFGGGMYNNGSSPTVTNSTFAGNSASSEGGGMRNQSNSSPTVTNSIIWNNRDNSGTGTASASIANSGSNPTITFSLVQAITTDDVMSGNKDGITNAGDANYPAFVTPVDPTTAPTTDGNLRLLPTSPAINMGDNAAVPADAFDVDDDGDTAEPTPDLDLNDRIVGTTVDMGAYESPCAAQAGELTNNLTSTTLAICQGTDPGFTFDATGENEDGTNYPYAFLLVNSSNAIVETTTDGNFELATLDPGMYTVYGLSYASFNTPDNIAAYLNGKSITDVQDDDAAEDLCLELTGTAAAGNTNVITVNANPTAAITPDPARVCEDDDLILDGNPSGGTPEYTHAWTGAGATLLSATDVQSPTFNSSEDGSFMLTYTVTDANLCTASDDITILVDPQVTINALSPQTICSTKKQPLSELFNGIIYNGGIPGDLTFEWIIKETDGDNGSLSDLDNTNANTGTYTPGEAAIERGFVTLVLTVDNDDDACEAVVAEVIITILKVNCGTFPWRGNE